MASSVSGQDEPNRALWLATRAGMILARDYPPCPGRKIYPKPKYKSFGDQAFFGQDGWILASFFFVGLWTSTPSWSINTQIKRGRGKNREQNREKRTLLSGQYTIFVGEQGSQDPHAKRIKQANFGTCIIFWPILLLIFRTSWQPSKETIF